MYGDNGTAAYDILGYINGDWVHLDREENDNGGFDYYYLDEEEEPVLYYSSQS